MEFTAFPKIPRLNRNCVITEKIDGTNAQIVLNEDGTFLAGSRNRYLTPEADNFGFAKWVRDNIEEIRKLGVGRFYGEWYGAGIQRGYGLTEKRFALFPTRPIVALPDCMRFVPTLYEGLFSTATVAGIVEGLRATGSVLVPGYPNPEGVIVYHQASKQVFKVTCEDDQKAKGEA